MSVWLTVCEGLVKVSGGWASGFERLAEGLTIDVEGEKVEVRAGHWEVVVVDRKVGSMFAEMKLLIQAVEVHGRGGCSEIC